MYIYLVEAVHVGEASGSVDSAAGGTFRGAGGRSACFFEALRGLRCVCLGDGFRVLRLEPGWDFELDDEARFARLWSRNKVETSCWSAIRWEWKLWTRANRP